MTCAEKPDLTSSDRLLASALKRLGAQVSPVIWTDPDALYGEWDGLVLRSVWDYHKRFQSFLEWTVSASHSSGRLINSMEVVRWNLQKSYLLELSQKDLPCVPSLPLRKEISAEAMVELVKEEEWSEIVVKPTISATAFLTFQSSLEDTALVDKLEKVRSQSDVLVQPYLSTVKEHGEVSLIFFNGENREFSHAVLKTPKEGDFRVQSDFGGTEAPISAPDGLKELADLALDTVPGDWVYARVDMIDWRTEPLISEIELIEPDLFLETETEAPEKFARAVFHKMAFA